LWKWYLVSVSRNGRAIDEKTSPEGLKFGLSDFVHQDSRPVEKIQKGAGLGQGVFAHVVSTNY
jgi:hypothetical protein